MSNNKEASDTFQIKAGYHLHFTRDNGVVEHCHGEGTKYDGGRLIPGNDTIVLTASEQKKQAPAEMIKNGVLTKVTTVPEAVAPAVSGQK